MATPKRAKTDFTIKEWHFHVYWFQNNKKNGKWQEFCYGVTPSQIICDVCSGIFSR